MVLYYSASFQTPRIMPCWYYEKKELRNTPSILEGIDYETECRYRMEGARFIIQTGTEMDLGCNTMATGVVFFHRFYMFHSFREFPRYVTAACCLFLAGKVEETPKKCKDVIRTARSLLSDSKFQQFGDNPKEEVLTLERILLQTIKFDLQVEHPYQYLLKYAKCLKGNKDKLQRMVQMAWTFVNDSLCTTLCVQWEPEVIAVALMYLAGKLSKFEVVDWIGRQSAHLFWWDMFVEDVTMNLLEDICHQVLDLYSAPKHPENADSPPLPKLAVTPKKIEPVSIAATPTTSNSIPVTPIKQMKLQPPIQTPQPIPVIESSKPMVVDSPVSLMPPMTAPPGFLIPPGAPPPPPPPTFVTANQTHLPPPPFTLPVGNGPPPVTSFPPPNYTHHGHSYPGPPFSSRPPNFYPPPQ